VQPELAEGRQHQRIGGIGNHEKDVAVLGAEPFQDSPLFRLTEKLNDVGVKLPVRDPHPGHALGPEGRHDFFGVLVLEHVFAQLFRLPRDLDPLDAPSALKNLPEDSVPGIGKKVGRFHKAETKAGIRSIRSVKVHGLLVSHPGKGTRQGDPTDGEHPHGELLDQVVEILFIDERGFQIELRELRLPVRPQILVPKTPDNLEIALEPRHHQKLLEELRRLGKGIEMFRVMATRHQVVTSTFRGALGEHGGFDFDESPFIQKITGGLDDSVALQEMLLHAGPA